MQVVHNNMYEEISPAHLIIPAASLKPLPATMQEDLKHRLLVRHTYYSKICIGNLFCIKCVPLKAVLPAGLRIAVESGDTD